MGSEDFYPEEAPIHSVRVTGSYGLAVNLARELPHVDLADAIRLTALAAEKDPD